MNKEEIAGYNRQFGRASAEEVLGHFTCMFGSDIVFASSLGAEDQVLTHMLAGISPSAEVVTLDTGRLFQETYDLIDRVRSRYKLNIRVLFPEASAVEAMVNERGMNLFYESVENRRLCCGIRKIEPLRRYLQGKRIWITGLRREQSITRTEMKLVEWDDTFGLMKLNPLYLWTLEQVWDYIRKHQVPYHALHDQGYPSIGCMPCTRAVSPGEDIRAGRWWWERPENKECGLHAGNDRPGRMKR
ncbi:MAG: phosphoadenylyl-sulfate reductase [Bacteroidales bacterium]|nr:phosphoadenylyl-sulfate reductase [Bacteroidales bacterium]